MDDKKRETATSQAKELNLDDLENVSGGAEDPVITPTNPIDPDMQDRA